MSKRFHHRKRVEFCETDAAGIAHFSAYFQYIEQAEHALWRHLGFSVFHNSEQVTWPRVSAHLDFKGAARFEQELDIEVTVKKLGNKSVTFASRISFEDACIAEGSVTAVCCRVLDGHHLQSVEIPALIRKALEAYVDSASV